MNSKKFEHNGREKKNYVNLGAMKLMVIKILKKGLEEFCIIFQITGLSKKALHVVEEFITVVAGATGFSWQNIGSTVGPGGGYSSAAQLADQLCI